tara:strand:+ start:1797 stop:2444 length:648 start_codon:yes stop_codon:yes gene_type:complete
MATSDKGPGSRTQSYTKRGLTRADIARLKKIRDKPSPKGTPMAKTDKDKFIKKKQVIGGLKAAVKKHGPILGRAAKSAILGTLGTFGPGKKLGMAVKGVKLAGKGAKSAAAGYVKLKTKIAKLKKKEKLSQVLKRKNKLSGVYGGKAAVAGGAAAALAAAAAGSGIQKYSEKLKKKKKTPMEKARDRKPSGRLTSDDIKRAMKKASPGGGRTRRS